MADSPAGGGPAPGDLRLTPREVLGKPRQVDPATQDPRGAAGFLDGGSLVTTPTGGPGTATLTSLRGFGISPMPKRRPPAAEDALARVVLDRYLAVRPGETVAIETWSHGLRWARPFLVEARRRGANPTLLVEDENAFFRSLEELGSAALARRPRALAPRGGVHVYLGGPEAFPRLFGLPPSDVERLMVRHDVAWWRAARTSRTRVVRLALGEATPTAAARYGVDVESWQAELLRASLVPPNRLAAEGRRLVHALGRGRRLRVRHPNGTDLTFVRGLQAPSVRTGRPDRAPPGAWGSAPSGLLVVPILRGTADGIWETNRPTYDRFAQPPVARGGRFRFQVGRLVEFSFDQGGTSFAAAYRHAGPGRERPVALTVGLNPAISHAPEALELASGTLGLLLGDPPYRDGRPRSGFSFLATLAGADVDIDARPWLVRGSAPAPRGRRHPTGPGGRRYKLKRSAKATRKARTFPR